MGIAPHHRLLAYQHRDKGALVAALLQRLEQRFLVARHRAAYAMPLAPELADADAGGRNLGHSRFDQDITTRPAVYGMSSECAELSPSDSAGQRVRS